MDQLRASFSPSQKTLLTQGDSSSNKEFPLHFAVQSQQSSTEMVERLIRSGVDLDAKDRQNLTALDHAILLEKPSLIEILLREKIGLFAKAAQKQIERPCFSGSISELNDRIEKVLAIDSSKLGPLQKAAYEGNIEELKKIRPQNELNLLDERGLAPIHYAVLGKKEDAFQTLFHKGADPKILTRGGNSILHLAAMANSLPLIQIALTLGILVNSQNQRGETALHYASAKEHLNGMKALIEKGADPTLFDFKGNSPLTVFIAKVRSKDPLALSSHMLPQAALGLLFLWQLQSSSPFTNSWTPALSLAFFGLYAAQSIHFVNSFKSSPKKTLSLIGSLGGELIPGLGLSWSLWKTGHIASASLERIQRGWQNLETRKWPALQNIALGSIHLTASLALFSIETLLHAQWLKKPPITPDYSGTTTLPPSPSPALALPRSHPSPSPSPVNGDTPLPIYGPELPALPFLTWPPNIGLERHLYREFYQGVCKAPSYEKVATLPHDPKPQEMPKNPENILSRSWIQVFPTPDLLVEKNSFSRSDPTLSIGDQGAKEGTQTHVLENQAKNQEDFGENINLDLVINASQVAAFSNYSMQQETPLPRSHSGGLYPSPSSSSINGNTPLPVYGPELPTLPFLTWPPKIGQRHLYREFYQGVCKAPSYEKVATLPHDPKPQEMPKNPENISSRSWIQVFPTPDLLVKKNSFSRSDPTLSIGDQGAKEGTQTHVLENQAKNQEDFGENINLDLVINASQVAAFSNYSMQQETPKNIPFYNPSGSWRQVFPGLELFVGNNSFLRGDPTLKMGNQDAAEEIQTHILENQVNSQEKIWPSKFPFAEKTENINLDSIINVTKDSVTTWIWKKAYNTMLYPVYYLSNYVLLTIATTLFVPVVLLVPSMKRWVILRSGKVTNIGLKDIWNSMREMVHYQTTQFDSLPQWARSIANFIKPPPASQMNLLKPEARGWEKVAQNAAKFYHTDAAALRREAKKLLKLVTGTEDELEAKIVVFALLKEAKKLEDMARIQFRQQSQSLAPGMW